MRELFVYYRVNAADAAMLRAKVVGMQARLCRDEPALRARVLRRPEAHDGQQTWMETYSADSTADGVGAELQARIESSARVLAPLIQGARHVEVFIPCAS